jgi:hypothetical protein
MNRNDMRGIVYLILSLVALYFLLDNYFGKGKINTFVDSFIGDFGGLPAKTDTSNQDKTNPSGGQPQTQEQPSAAQIAAANKVLLQSQQDTGNIATGTVPTTKPAAAPAKPKSGGAGLGLNDIFGAFHPFPLGIPLAGAAAAAAAGIFALPQQLAKEMGAAF